MSSRSVQKKRMYLCLADFVLSKALTAMTLLITSKSALMISFCGQEGWWLVKGTDHYFLASHLNVQHQYGNFSTLIICLYEYEEKSFILLKHFILTLYYQCCSIFIVFIHILNWLLFLYCQFSFYFSFCNFNTSTSTYFIPVSCNIKGPILTI